MPVRCYRLWDVNDGELCVVVAARNAREARKLFWLTVKFDLCMDRYIDLRATHQPDVNVDDLLEPQVLDYKDGLRRGASVWVDDNCDVCNNIRNLTLVNGRCLCSDCEENFYDAEILKKDSYIITFDTGKRS